MYYILTVQCALIISIGLRSVCLQVCHETFNILLGAIRIIDLRSWFDLKKLIIYNFVACCSDGMALIGTLHDDDSSQTVQYSRRLTDGRQAIRSYLPESAANTVMNTWEMLCHSGHSKSCHLKYIKALDCCCVFFCHTS